MDSKKDQRRNFSLRMPPDLSEAVKQAAIAKDMSVNKFIIDRLKRSVKRKRKTG